MGLNRRELLGACTATILGGGAIGTALGYGPFAEGGSTQPAYLDLDPIVYEHSLFQLLARPSAVRRGRSITFELRHTGVEEASGLGCDVPWAMQRYEDGEWHHAVWTGPRFTNMCAGPTPEPGETIRIDLNLSAKALADEPYIGEVDVTFTPSTYRFIIVHADPPLAVNFQILDTE